MSATAWFEVNAWASEVSAAARTSASFGVGFGVVLGDAWLFFFLTFQNENVAVARCHSRSQTWRRYAIHGACGTKRARGTWVEESVSLRGGSEGGGEEIFEGGQPLTRVWSTPAGRNDVSSNGRDRWAASSQR